MQFADSHKTSIGTLRFASHNRDTLSVQLELDRMLSPADLHPAGLPSTSIVCIRKFTAQDSVPLFASFRVSPGNWLFVIRSGHLRRWPSGQLTASRRRARTP